VRRAATGAVALAAILSSGAAEARCVHAGLVYSCLTISGKHVMLSCYGSGTGGVQTCIDFHGNSMLVGRHWRNHLDVVPATPGETGGSAGDDDSADASTPDTASASGLTVQSTMVEDSSFDSQLSSALAANPDFGKSASEKTGTSTTGKSSTGSASATAVRKQPGGG
jgi:hypothetical protein